MAIAFHADLRARVILACKEHKKSEVAKFFKISLKTVERYCSQMERLGHLRPKECALKGHSHKLLDPTPLIKLVEENPTMTLKEMGKRLRCSISTVQRKLIKLGFTQKKGLRSIRKETKQSAPFFEKK